MSVDFTLDRYTELLVLAKMRYRFCRFTEVPEEAEIALWRHDVDFSPQRALAMARREAKHEVVATYFIQLNSRFYSAFEPETVKLLRGICALGHEVGLHFEPSIGESVELAEIEERLKFEALTLSNLVGEEILAFSLHNPTTMGGFKMEEPAYAGLVNASSLILREAFTYCSDSNGIWRFRSLAEVIADGNVTRLYSLTHPEWWQEAYMPPRERIRRSIQGRAAFCLRYYDDLLRVNARPNEKL